ncbi:MAG: hypothetical protein A2Y66_01185 [Nitrospirae bacterium RBG_13_41_22]|nr:MAG: hypothetical protein A2Y66_01185 [Nitrospirae bacterium RBG_13_41_22]
MVHKKSKRIKPPVSLAKIPPPDKTLSRTYRKPTTQKTKKSQAETAVFLEGIRLVIGSQRFEDAAASLFNSCKKLTKATSGYIALVTEDGKQNDVAFLDSGGLPCNVDPTLPMPLRGLREKVYNSGKAICNNDFSQSEFMELIPEGHVPIKNVLFVPLLIKNKGVGLLGLANKKNGFSEKDVRIALAFGDLAAIALMNKRSEELLRKTLDELESRVQERTSELTKINKALRDEIAKRKKVEDSLRKSEASYRIVADNTYDWEFWLSPEGRFIYISPSCKRITGYGVEEFMADSDLLYRITHPNDKMQLENHRHETMQKMEPGALEFRIIRPDGTFRWIDHVCQPVFDKEGNFLGTRGSNRDITDRKLTEEALRESEKQLRYLSSQLIVAQEIERKRISRELHDELGQALTLMKMRLRFINENLRNDQTILKEECENSFEYINQVIENVRRLSQDLSPLILEDLGLTAGLKWLINNFVKNNSIQIAHDIENIDRLLSQDSRIIIYRILQETLTNIIKHSKAEKVSVVISKDDDKISFLVEDNGIGFNLNNAVIKKDTPIGLGLRTIEERVRILGGSLELQSQEGKGTRITLSIPIKKESSL